MNTETISAAQIIVSFNKEATSIAEVDEQLQQSEKHWLGHAPWQNEFPYKPAVQFAIAYGTDGLYLQYEVREEQVRAMYRGVNDPVYQDSCVEFFISFDDGISYYNLEFNCIGTVLGGYGTDRKHRHWLPEAVLQTIQSQSLLEKGGDHPFVYWRLTVIIPFSLFYHHSLPSLKGQQCKANFYKCGDLLPKPHYLCWAKIQSGEPDFHLPQFFGTLLFG